MQPAAVVRQSGRQSLVCHRQDLSSQQSGIEATADGHRGNGNTTGHLHDRVQRIHPGQRTASDGNTDHRQGGEGRHHPRQMGGTTGTGHNHTESLSAGRLGKGHHFQRCAVG